MNPRAQQATVRESKDTYWVEVPVGDAWIAACRMVVRDNRPLIAEMRLFPAEPAPTGTDFQPGEWSGSQNRHASIPGSGVTAGLIKTVKVSPAVGLLAIRREKTQQMAESYWAARDIETEAKPKSTRGRKSKPVAFYAGIAKVYAEIVKDGSDRPIFDLAKREGLPESLAKAYVHRARQRGFLTPTSAGSSGGELTARAAALLKTTGKAKSKR